MLRPPEACYSLGVSTAVEGQTFDIWSYGILSLSLWTDSFFRITLDVHKYWPKRVYPMLFQNVQFRYFSALVKRTYPFAAVSIRERTQAQKLIRGILRFYPEQRPSISAIRRHLLISGKESEQDLLEGDIIWTQFHQEKDLDMNAFVKEDISTSEVVPSPVLDEKSINQIKLDVKRIVKEAYEHVKKMEIEHQKKSTREKVRNANGKIDVSPTEVVRSPVMDEKTINDFKMGVKRIINKTVEHVEKMKTEKLKKNAREKDLEVDANANEDARTSVLIDITGEFEVASRPVINGRALNQVKFAVRRIISDAIERVKDMEQQQTISLDKSTFQNVEEETQVTEKEVQISTKRPSLRKRFKDWFHDRLARMCSHYNCRKQKSSMEI